MNISGYNLFDIANGPGIRVSLFVSGCQFHCKGCFNQKALDYSYGVEYSQEIEDKIIEQLKHSDYRGLSLLGGDPLWQDDDGLEKLISLCKKVHELGKDIWMWTGFTWDSIFNGKDDLQKELVENVDILIDGRFIKSKKDLSIAWRGSSNQNIIDVKEKLKAQN